MKRFLVLGICLLMATSAFAQQQFITIATGGTAGTYFPLGGALADIWNKNIPKMNATAQATGASIANINLLKGGNVDVIFTQNDVASYSYNGTELLKDQAYKDLRGMACLYNETIQLVALESSGIKTITDLKGKKVSVGAAGSGTEANARQILESAGLTYNDIKVQYLSFGESLTSVALKNEYISLRPSRTCPSHHAAYRHKAISNQDPSIAMTQINRILSKLHHSDEDSLIHLV